MLLKDGRKKTYKRAKNDRVIFVLVLVKSVPSLSCFVEKVTYMWLHETNL